jgi:predicted DNA-binding transcriptional regulator YafY
VEPHRLVSTGYRWYLMAFDVARGDWRTFRVDRIIESADAGQRFVPRDAPDPAAFVATALTSAPYRYQARVLVDAPAAAVAEQFSATSGVVSEADDGRCLLTTGADSLELLTFYIAAIGADFTVLEPPELTEFIAATADRLRRACDSSASGA